jgi:hypothetical protein
LFEICYCSGSEPRKEAAMTEDSRIYFARRAAEEQERAEQASDPIAAGVHRRLQRVYAERASIGERWQAREVVG